MTDSGVGPRRDAIVARLRAARTGYERCVGDVSPEIGMDGTEWSILDLLHHSIDSGYQDMAKRFVEESTPEFSGVYDPAADWRQATENMLGSVDNALSLANSLTPDQMSRQIARLSSLRDKITTLEQRAISIRSDSREALDAVADLIPAEEEEACPSG